MENNVGYVVRDEPHFRKVELWKSGKEVGKNWERLCQRKS